LNALGRLVGVGDYGLVGGARSTSSPAIHIARTANGNVEISGHVYLGLISTTASTTQIWKFPLRADSVKTFPDLVALATGYEKQRLKQCVFKTTPVCALDTSSGQMAFGLASNPDNTDPTTLEAVAAMAGGTIGGIMQPGAYYVECAGNQWLSIANSGTVPTGDLKDYCFGEFFIGTNTNVTGALCQVSVDYTVELKGTQTSAARCGINHTIRTGVTSAVPLGSASASVTSFGCTPTMTFTSGTVLTLSDVYVGEVFLVMTSNVNATSGATTTPTINLNNFSFVGLPWNGGTYGNAKGFPNAAVTCTDSVCMAVIRYTGPTGGSGTLTYSGATFTASPTSDVYLFCLGNFSTTF